MSLIPAVTDIASNVSDIYYHASSSSSSSSSSSPSYNPQMSNLNTITQPSPTLSKSKSPTLQRRCQSCKKKKLFVECKFCTLLFCCSCIMPEVHRCAEQKKCTSHKIDELSKTLMNGLCIADKVNKI